MFEMSSLSPGISHSYAMFRVYIWWWIRSFCHMPYLKLVSTAAVNAFFVKPSGITWWCYYPCWELVLHKTISPSCISLTARILHIDHKCFIDFITRLLSQPRWRVFTTSLSSILGCYLAQKASKSTLKVTRFVKIQTFQQLSYKF